jgi:MFS family permease
MIRAGAAGRPLGAAYWKLATATGLSNLGDGIRLVAFPWLTATLTQDPLLVTAVAAAAQLAWLVLPIPAGVIIDRFDRRALMVAGYSVHLVVGVVVGVLFMVDRLSVEVLVPLAILTGCAEVILDTTALTLLPAVVNRDQLIRASGYLVGAEISTQMLIGRPLGGLLSGLSSAVAFFAKAALGAICAVMSLFVIPRRAFRRPPTTAAPGSMGNELRQGLRWLWAHRLLRDIGIIIAVSNILYGATIAIFVLFARDILHVGALGFGLIGSCVAVGGVLGSVVASPLTRHLGERGAFLLVIFVTAGAFGIVGLASHPALAASMLALVGGMFTVWEAVWRAMRIRLVPERLLGRVTSILRWLEMGPFPLASLCGGAIVVIGTTVHDRELGLRLPYFLTAAVFVVLGFWLQIAMSPRRAAVAEHAVSTRAGRSSGRRSLEIEHTEVGGPPRGVAPVADAELVDHRGDMAVHGPDREHEPRGDLGVGEALAEQLQDLELALGEAGRVVPGAADRATRDRPHAGSPQVGADDAR